jgi:hypothetical protein
MTFEYTFVISSDVSMGNQLGFHALPAESCFELVGKQRPQWVIRPVDSGVIMPIMRIIIAHEGTM